MIRAVSLIPAPLVRQRRKDRRVRAWAVACAGAVAVGIAAPALVRAAVIDPHAPSAADLASASAALADLNGQRETLRARALGAAATLRAVRVASDHPDWSILLAFISDRCGDRVSLSSFTLEPDAGGAGFDVRLEGAGLTQPDVAGLMLALEQSGVFASTRLNGAGATEEGGPVRFSATCLIRPAGAEAGTGAGG